MRILWIDEQTGESISYERFCSIVASDFSKQMRVECSSVFQVFYHVIRSMFLDVPLKLERCPVADNWVVSYLQPVPDPDEGGLIRLEGSRELKLSAQSMEQSRWRLVLPTSGSTGVPRLITHDLGSLCRYTKIEHRHQGDIWGFTYDPAHIGGIQILFQAAFNRNPIVNLNIGAPGVVGSIIREYSLTHISATSTFYRLLLARLDGSYPSVKRLIVSGETFDDELMGNIGRSFPNAALRNIYALTETGAVLVSETGIFHLNPKISEKVRISADDELMLHSSLYADQTMGRSAPDWQLTGDLVERIPDGGFRITHRRGDVVNVAGNKVLLPEVENFLRSLPGVSEARVKSRKSKLVQHILIAEITVDPISMRSSDLLVQDIHRRCTARLHPWQRPRFIKLVEKISTTATGKRCRQ